METIPKMMSINENSIADIIRIVYSDSPIGESLVHGKGSFLFRLIQKFHDNNKPVPTIIINIPKVESFI